MQNSEAKECSLPPPLTEDEISAAADGRPSRRAHAHLRDCAYCERRVEMARRFEASLAQMLNRFDCPPAQRLGDYTLGLLTPLESTEIAQHIEYCARCATEASDLRIYLGLDAETDAVERLPAPQSAKSQAKARRSLSLPHVALDEIFATLLPRAPSLAYRGIASEREPLVAQSGDTIVTLEVTPAGETDIQVLGSVAAIDPDAWAGALALLWIDGEIRAAATLDENGGFETEPFRPGIAALRITPERGPTLVLQDLHLE